MKTPAKFYYHTKNDDLYCIFLDDNRILSDKGIFFLSYTHIGQHSECHIDYIKESKPAKRKDFQDLETELTNLIGYDLEIFENEIDLSKYVK